MSQIALILCVLVLIALTSSNACDGLKENAFVRIHINNMEIMKKVESLQEKQLMRKSPNFRPHFQFRRSLHSTIITTAVDQHNTKNAIKAMNNVVKEFREYLDDGESSFQIKVKGLKSFGKRVLLAGFEDTWFLDVLNELCMDEFHKQGLQAYNSAGHVEKYHPHMSIVNIKDKKMEYLGGKWANMLDKKMCFGVQEVNSIQLVKYGVNLATHDYDVIYEAKF